MKHFLFGVILGASAAYYYVTYKVEKVEKARGVQQAIAAKLAPKQPAWMGLDKRIDPLARPVKD